MNIISNDNERFFVFLQLVILGLINLVTLKKIDGLDAKVGALVKEFKNQKL